MTIEIQHTDIPALGFGTYKLTGQACVDAIAMALRTGYRHLDTAQMYDNEAEVGQGLAVSGVERDSVFVTTKVWMDKVAPGALQKSVEQSLKNLKTDYVDMLLIHWPNTAVPFAEQMQALRDVHNQGKTKLIGVSNFTVAMLTEIVETLGVPLANLQVEYHPYLDQRPLLEFVRAHDMMLTAYAPLAHGKVNDDVVLKRIGKLHGKTPGQTALRWLIQQDNVAAIPKAGSPQHIADNFNIYDFELSEAEMGEIFNLARADGRLINPSFAPKWDLAA